MLKTSDIFILLFAVLVLAISLLFIPAEDDGDREFVIHGITFKVPAYYVIENQSDSIVSLASNGGEGFIKITVVEKVSNLSESSLWLGYYPNEMNISGFSGVYGLCAKYVFDGNIFLFNLDNKTVLIHGNPSNGIDAFLSKNTHLVSKLNWTAITNNKF